LPTRIAAALGLVTLLAGWTFPSPRPQPPPAALDVPILMYHRVGPEPRGPAMTDALTVPAADFAAQMRWLRRAGFAAVTQRQLFDALENGGVLPPRPIVITFDDGYRDVLWNAAPVLHRLRMPATAYVITARISGPDPSFLTWRELRQLERYGVAIGSHTEHHVELTHVSPDLALAELVGSRQTLERRLGRPVPWLSYPAGAVDPAVVRLVRRAGYELAVTTHAGDNQDGRRPLELQRIEVVDGALLQALLKSES
jgi:peptidoglycan/xylan/chitin deacetylase (PgdA/CDA1 family)